MMASVSEPAGRRPAGSLGPAVSEAVIRGLPKPNAYPTSLCRARSSAQYGLTFTDRWHSTRTLLPARQQHGRERPQRLCCGEYSFGQADPPTHLEVLDTEAAQQPKQPGGGQPP